ncbi:hypothetical protein E5288_WYG022819 [Bos mutus]|uniref:Membrane protein FAM174B n=1 Tax=Bos mutus TaxID=72004 RepID=A0A6B0QZS8_9CETA|nr:hypothetical protein [Bos mutus]
MLLAAEMRLLRDLPTLKAAVIVACAFTAFLIACLLLRVFRSGKRLKKTRKYDIITTPAERVEMAPLNEEDDEDEDSTVFDIKYRTSQVLVAVESEAQLSTALRLEIQSR